MRRAARILANVLTVLSLALATLVAVLWVRSRTRYESVDRSGNDTERSLVSTGGSLTYSMRRGFEHGPTRYRGQSIWIGTPPGFMRPAATWYERIGFRHVNVPKREVFVLLGQVVEIVMPHWFVMSIALIAPSAWTFGHLRARRLRSASRCAECGYDLRATPERCPECGRVSAISK